ncbi:MAG: efflux RND transporter permease subunit [Spirochaetales bacterium]|nr:efflux RND transporter permease subunit [Spirochaetales bacterium]
MYSLAEEIIRRTEDTAGLKNPDISVDITKPYLRIIPDRGTLSCFGLSSKNVYATVAAAVRLRDPILMTTLTTVAGLLPLALMRGEGLEMLKPLAVTVVGGLMVSAFLPPFCGPIALYGAAQA